MNNIIYLVGLVVVIRRIHCLMVAGASLVSVFGRLVCLFGRGLRNLFIEVFSLIKVLLQGRQSVFGPSLEIVVLAACRIGLK